MSAAASKSTPFTLEQLDAAFEAEIKRVSTLQYNSNEICRWFYQELRANLSRTASEKGASA